MAVRGKLVLQIAAIGVVGLLIALLAWRLASRAEGQGVAERADKGERPYAPDFELARLGGDGTIRLSSLRGQVVVLNFWASWCVPCREEAPLLEAASQRYRDQGVVFLGVNAQDFRGDAKRFVVRYGITYENVEDGPGSTLGRFGVAGFPETYFLDRQGRIVVRIPRQVEQEDLDRSIALALESS